MYTRAHTLSLSLPTSSFGQFGYKPMARSTEPEVFTFDHVPSHVAPPRSMPVRQRKRVTRVMYPSKVRKYLPPAEKSPAKRWLLALCLVVFLQIYTEEGAVDAAQAAPEAVAELPGEDSSMAQYNVFPFQSAEEQARQMMACPGGHSTFTSRPGGDSSWSLLVNKTCPSSRWERDMTALSRQSTRNGYVVALLYPVYHTLGSEQ